MGLPCSFFKCTEIIGPERFEYYLGVTRGSGPYLFELVSPWRINQIKNQTAVTIAVMNAAAANTNIPAILSPEIAVAIPTNSAARKVTHMAICASPYQSCHHPVLHMSCSLLVVNEMLGIRNTIHTNQFTIGIKLNRK